MGEDSVLLILGRVWIPLSPGKAASSSGLFSELLSGLFSARHAGPGG